MNHDRGLVKPGLLLHICCAPCSTHVVRTLAGAFEVVGFFYNPNIQPRAEYEARLYEAQRLAGALGFPLITGEYDPEHWNRNVVGFFSERDMGDGPSAPVRTGTSVLTAQSRAKREGEGGERCKVCYRVRLARAARAARDEGCEYLATTLTVSPHKRASIINPVGEEEASRFEVKFYAADFKKKDGFRKSCQLSKEWGLYRQNYCGCIYSLRPLTCTKKEEAKVERIGNLSRPWPHGEGDDH